MPCTLKTVFLRDGLEGLVRAANPAQVTVTNSTLLQSRPDGQPVLLDATVTDAATGAQIITRRVSDWAAANRQVLLPDGLERAPELRTSQSWPDAERHLVMGWDSLVRLRRRDTGYVPDRLYFRPSSITSVEGQKKALDKGPWKVTLEENRLIGRHPFCVLHLEPQQGPDPRLTQVVTYLVSACATGVAFSIRPLRPSGPPTGDGPPDVLFFFHFNNGTSLPLKAAFEDFLEEEVELTGTTPVASPLKLRLVASVFPDSQEFAKFAPDEIWPSDWFPGRGQAGPVAVDGQTVLLLRESNLLVPGEFVPTQNHQAFGLDLRQDWPALLGTYGIRNDDRLGKLGDPRPYDPAGLGLSIARLAVESHVDPAARLALIREVCAGVFGSGNVCAAILDSTSRSRNPNGGGFLTMESGAQIEQFMELALGPMKDPDFLRTPAGQIFQQAVDEYGYFLFQLSRVGRPLYEMLAGLARDVSSADAVNLAAKEAVRGAPVKAKGTLQTIKQFFMKKAAAV